MQFIKQGKEICRQLRTFERYWLCCQPDYQINARQSGPVKTKLLTNDPFDAITVDGTFEQLLATTTPSLASVLPSGRG
jgi:hypothetical protein